MLVLRPIGHQRCAMSLALSVLWPNFGIAKALSPSYSNKTFTFWALITMVTAK